jgi:hypothetical protein
VLTDSNADWIARTVAFHIARVAPCEDLRGDLATVALDSREVWTMRQNALLALEPVARAEDREALRPLIQDPEDEIKGAALRLLWPGTITTAEMLACLTPRHSMQVSGFYRDFLVRRLVSCLSGEDLPIALAWMAELILQAPKAQSHTPAPIREFREICAALYQRAMARAAEPAVFQPLCSLILTLLRPPDWIWAVGADRQVWSQVPENIDLRRSLAMAVLRRATAEDVEKVFFFDTPLVGHTDGPWLAAALNQEREPGLRVLLAQLLAQWGRRDNEEEFELLYESLEKPEFHSFRALITCDRRIDNEYVEMLRRQWKERNRPPPPSYPPLPSGEELAAQAAQDIQACESDQASWQRFIECMCRTAYGLCRHFSEVLSRVWVWDYLDAATRDRVPAAALCFLECCDPQTEQWWDSYDDDDLRPLAGYLALQALVEAKITVSPELWAKWAPVLFMFMEEHYGELWPSDVNLAAQCHRLAPDAFIHWLDRRLEHLSARDESIFQFRLQLRQEWSPAIAALVARTLDIPSLPWSVFEAGLHLLFRNHDPASEPLVQAALEGRQSRERSVIILGTWFRNGKGLGWRRLRPLMAADPLMGEEILYSACSFEGGGSFGQFFENEMSALSDDDLADIVLDLGPEHCPLSGKGPWEDIAQVFAAKGTPSALAALERIQAAGPKMDWVSRYIIGCRDNLRRTTWVPPAPKAVMAMAAERDKRFVRSGAELLEVVIESLQRLQKSLLSKRPVIGNLWNTLPGAFSPKSESEISDVIALHLESDICGRGIVVNREVQLRPRLGDQAGERTDIHIDAVTAGDHPDTLTMVIEVKGCWHDEVKTAFNTQLVDRYLTGSGVQHGLYLVGWFYCRHWVDKDRKPQTGPRNWSLADACALFAQQAVAASRDGRDVRALVLDARYPDEDRQPEY